MLWCDIGSLLASHAVFKECPYLCACQSFHNENHFNSILAYSMDLVISCMMTDGKHDTFASVGSSSPVLPSEIEIF